MKNFKFIYNRKITYVISTILVLTSIIALVVKGPNWSIDFTGGQQIMVKIDPTTEGQAKIDVETVRQALEKEGLSEANIQELSYKLTSGDEDGTSSENSAMFVIKTTEDEEAVAEEATEAGEKKVEKTEIKAQSSLESSNIITAIQKNIPNYKVDMDGSNIEIVKSSIGKELKDKAWKSVLISLLLMVLYIGIRFQFNFGIAAIIALFHDVTITLGVFCILGLDVSAAIIAALLSIVGYSINDTIVVFDRIREDLRKRKADQDLDSVFNTSINRTLSRTIITSCTTLLAAVALYVFAGIVIRDFAFAIIIGTLIGTYSSIFVASPLVLDYFHSQKNDSHVFSRIMNRKKK